MIFNRLTPVNNHLFIDLTVERVWANGKEKSFKLVGLHIDKKLNG